MLEEPAMAERLHRSSDVPTYDTYPASPPVSQNAPGLEESLLAQGRARLLEEGRPPSSLEKRGAELGTAAGKLVSIVKHARRKTERLPQHPVFDRLSHLADNLADNARTGAESLRSQVEDRAQQLVQMAREKTADLSQQAREKAVVFGRQAKTGYYRARLRANQTAREYPVHVVVAAGVVGILIGVGLRIRRANRAY
jgi:ElaB/YqjD/DUF883 family membrane-anchored ribosome-binding protein